MKLFRQILFGSTWAGRLMRILTLLTIFAYPFGYHYRLVYIDGISMEPTYNDGQWSLEQRARSLGDGWVPDRFDVITVWSDEDDCKLCKRVIGLPGETIEVKDGIIFIDGKKMNDAFGKGKVLMYLVDENEKPLRYWETGEWGNAGDPVVELTSHKEEKIPKGYVWVIGDNREDSIFGHFPIKEIRGKVVLY